ncbi:MAG: thiamine pyrophosphate-dependent enzyme [Promethearchaeota archaeon]
MSFILGGVKAEEGMPQHPLMEKKIIYNAKHTGLFKSWFCSGCGYGSVAQWISNVFLEDDLDVNTHPFINGIGCYSLIPLLLPGKILMNLHGRGLAVATGVKLANPRLKPIIIAGDGDLLSIGTNHFIHAARRNLDCVLILLHNLTFGMTGGQISPTAPLGSKHSTAPYGSGLEAIDAVELAKVSGATYIARCTTAQPYQFMKYFRNALNHKGFAIIDVISQCVTYFGRRNNMGKPTEIFNWIKNQTVSIKQSKSMSEKDLKDKFITGEFLKTRRKTISEIHAHMIESLRGDI